MKMKKHSIAQRQDWRTSLQFETRHLPDSAQYKARALLNKGVYDDATLCNGGGQSAASKVKKEDSGTAKLKAIPNPASGAFSILLPQPLENEATAQIIIFDQLGREVFHRSITGPINMAELDASNWPSGIYWCTLLLENGTVFTTLCLIEKI